MFLLFIVYPLQLTYLFIKITYTPIRGSLVLETANFKGHKMKLRVTKYFILIMREHFSTKYFYIGYMREIDS